MYQSRTVIARAMLILMPSVTLLTVSSATVARAQAPGQPGTQALEFRAFTLGPHPVAHSLADYHGKVILLALWATWCTGCREEMASMQRLYSAYAARGFRVVAVSIDRGDDKKILEFAQANGLTFEILRDESGRILTTYLTQGVPTTILIDRNGVIRRRNLASVDWDVDPRLAQVRSLLGPSPSASPPGTR